jgi:hypothetical protein
VGGIGGAGLTGLRGDGGLFSVCLDSSDCAAGYICACGAICTVGCSAASDSCDSLGLGAICPDLVPVTANCHPPGGQGCVVRCSSDVDCVGLASTAACLQGWCKIPQPSTLVDGSAPSCDDRLAPLRTQVESAIAAADRSCAVDADCVNVTASNSCYGTDCPLTYVSKTAGDELDMLLATLDAQFCDAILRSGCALPRAPHGCPGYRSPVCLNGVCSQKPLTSVQPDAATD